MNWLKKLPRWQILLFLGFLLAFDIFARFFVESLWFQEVGYFEVFWQQLITRGVLWICTLFLSSVFLLGNLAIAERLKYPQDEKYNSFSEKSLSKLSNFIPPPPVITLPWLLLIVLGLGVFIGAITIYYSLVAASYWHSEIGNLLKINNSPPRWQPQIIWLLWQQLPSIHWQVGVPLALASALIIFPALLWAIAFWMSLILGFILSNNWEKFLLFLHPTTFNSTEPVFGHDISFYVFTLPILELIEFWLGGISLLALAVVSLTYLLSGNSLSEGRFLGFSQPQQRHLYTLGGVVMLAIAFFYWLRRYELLYSTRGVTYGASFTDINVQLPVNTLLSIIALAIALIFLWQTRKKFQSNLKKIIYPYPWLLIYTLTGYTIIAAFTSSLLPFIVQRAIVQPNEIEREKPYIERSIAFTRAAFDLNDIEVRTFNPQGRLSAAEILENHQTIRNIRLWDTRPLLETNRQLQQIRLYYKFAHADIDRYTLKAEPRETIFNTSFWKNLIEEVIKLGTNTQLQIPKLQTETEKQQVIVAARELDYSAVPEAAKTWVNQHLVYTHGYGFTISPVNKVAPGGLPEYFVKDIGVGLQTLRTSSPRISASIPIGHPRIYYGEITDTYVMAPTKVKELDYPQGEENVYNTYDGSGGILIGNWWRRLLFAEYLKDWQMIFTPEFKPETKLLFRRNIKKRVEAIAPFLRYDSDPYLVIAKANILRNNPATEIKETASEENYLYWIIDAYTTSDRYPYSEPYKYNFNYIRNSVKVVIDAYNGNLAFYIADKTDPLVASWSTIFPNMFKPLSAMSPSLRSHIRYPSDLFNIQSERLLTYHMTEPQVFYNRDDQWRIPNEIYGSEQQKVQPYYLIMKLPTATSEEFILLLPFTPASRNNLIAWLAARSDGENYGKLLLYQFPKQKLIYGTEQIEARINQDPVISQQISLWNREGSRAIQGNLLVIPIAQSLLYVEPLYLEAQKNSLPTLARVIVAYENRIAMAETLEAALTAVLKSQQPTAPAIIRPVEEP